MLEDEEIQDSKGRVKIESPIIPIWPYDDTVQDIHVVLEEGETSESNDVLEFTPSIASTSSPVPEAQECIYATFPEIKFELHTNRKKKYC